MKNTLTFLNKVFQKLWAGIKSVFFFAFGFGVLLWYSVPHFVLYPLLIFDGLTWVFGKLVSDASVTVQFWVLLISSLIIILFARDFSSEDRLRWIMSQDYGHILGEFYPLAFPIWFVAISLPYFSGLSCALKIVNLIKTVPNFVVNDKCVVQFDLFYIWHILDSIPLLKFPQTILWNVPHQYTDSLSGFILIILKVIIILPAIKAFIIWRKVTSKDEVPKKT